MRVAVDTRVSAAVPVLPELVMDTVQRGLVVLAATAGGSTHPEFQQDATAGTVVTGKGTTHRGARLEARFIVLARDHKVGPLPVSLLGRQITLVAITPREIDPALVLRVNPVSSLVITRVQIGISASNAPAQLQGVQRGRTGLGHGRMQRTGSDSTRKPHKDCVIGKAKRLDMPMLDVITKNTGKIAITMTMIGGVIIATLLFLLVGVFGAGMTAGGIQPGVMTRTTPTTITMVPSMGTMDFNPTK
jgi:hypothetical protein